MKLKERENKNTYIDLTRGLKKTMEDESDVYTNCNWCFWYSHQRIKKGIGELGNERTNGDHPSNYTIEIGQNTEKGSGDLRRLAVS